MGTDSSIFDKKFIEKNLLSKNGNLNARALEKYKISKEEAYQVFHRLSEPPKCKTCSNYTKFVSFKKGYMTFCSVSCASGSNEVNEKRKRTLVSNYGTDSPWTLEIIKNKKKKTSIAHYGVDHPMKSNEFRKEKERRCIENYGVKSVASLESTKDKRKDTNLKKYGVDNPSKLPKIKEKIKLTNIEKYGVSTTLLLDSSRAKSLEVRRNAEVYSNLTDKQWLEDHKDVPSTMLSDQLGVAFSTILNYYKSNGIARPNIIASKQEHEIIEFLNDHNIEIIRNNRTILNGKEIDIYLPEYNLAIEVDGVYWHSEKFIQDRFYHVNKTNSAKNAGVQLIHILDYEWNNKSDIVKNRLLAKLKKSKRIYARKCSIIELNNNEYCEFVNKYHIQGSAAASIRLGLTFEGQLVAVMSFSKARYNKRIQWELIRYASVDTVVGGASRLFKHFLNKLNPASIISYADLRWNTGDLYKQLGMTLVGNSNPNYWYFDGKTLNHRSAFQKHKLNNKLKIYDKTLSEWENMQANGFTRYWDCGNAIYVWGQINDKN